VDLKEIRKIVELMNEHDLTYFDMSKDDFHLKLKKGQDLEAIRNVLALMPQPAMAAPAPQASPAGPPVPVDPQVAPAAEGEAILSPMVGTFYRQPSPDAASFVEVGAPVSEGQTLCIIEAMKVMNEIKAERSGTIIEIHVEDGSPVQYGDPLFQIK
jgi:acetyl-CoA carboxylase biotin carboxyl carrier protein